MDGITNHHGMIYVLNIETSEEIASWQAHEISVTNCDVSNNGLLVTTDGRELCLWELSTGKLLSKCEYDPREEGFSDKCSITADGTHIMAHTPSCIYVWKIDISHVNSDLSRKRAVKIIARHVIEDVADRLSVYTLGYKEKDVNERIDKSYISECKMSKSGNYIVEVLRNSTLHIYTRRHKLTGGYDEGFIINKILFHCEFAKLMSLIKSCFSEYGWKYLCLELKRPARS